MYHSGKILLFLGLWLLLPFKGDLQLKKDKSAFITKGIASQVLRSMAQNSGSSSLKIKTFFNPVSFNISRKEQDYEFFNDSISLHSPSPVLNFIASGAAIAYRLASA